MYMQNGIKEHTSYLHLPSVTALEYLQPSNLGFQRRAKPHYAKRVQHLRYAIVCKHGDFVNIVEFAVPFTIERSP